MCSGVFRRMVLWLAVAFALACRWSGASGRGAVGGSMTPLITLLALWSLMDFRLGWDLFGGTLKRPVAGAQFKKWALAILPPKCCLKWYRLWASPDAELSYYLSSVGEFI